MRFYTQQHQLYCGIDLPARTMSLCILNRDGEILVHRRMPAGPAPLLKAIAPYREDVVVCVACLFTWYWLADLYALLRDVALTIGQTATPHDAQTVYRRQSVPGIGGETLRHLGRENWP